MKITGKEIQTPPRAQQRDDRDPKMLEAAQGFENQFIKQLVSEMRKSIPKDELVPETMADDLYRDWLDDEYVKTWVQQGGVGLTDTIYDQLQQQYGTHATLPHKAKNEIIPLNQKKLTNELHDLLSEVDGGKFLAKKTQTGLNMKSRGPLGERVALHAPLSGIVMQAAVLEDGRQLIKIKHDQGLVTQIVHSGKNLLKTNTAVSAGDAVAELLPATQGEPANVVFELRKKAALE